MILKYCIANQFIPQKSREELTPAELKVLVDVGFEKRQEDEDFWLDQLLCSLFADFRDVAVIPNVRYQNEIDFVKRHRGVVVFIKALNPNGSDFISTDRDPNHVSECGLNERDADFYIVAKRPGADWVSAQGAALLDVLLKRSAI
jgi:hypothetical protein